MKKVQMRKNRLMFHLKKAVSNFDARPALKCVQYHKNGCLYATDSHVAIRVNDFHEGENELLFDISTMEIKNLVYPDLEPNFEKLEVNCEAEIYIPTFMKALRPFVDKSIISPAVKMTVGNNVMKIESDDIGFNEELKMEFPLNDTEGEIIISANPIYLMQALEFARDADAASPKGETKKIGVVNVKFNDPIRPFLFTVGDYDYMVMPVRAR